MSASTTQAPSPISRAAIALPDAAGAAGHQRDAPRQRFRLRHALKLRLLEQPIFDVERLLLGEADVAADAGGAAHDVDRVDVEFRGDAGGRLVLGEGQHADARDEVDDGVGIAHRRRVRPPAALIVGRVVRAIVRKSLVERSDDRVEIVAPPGRKAARAGGSWCAGSDQGRTFRAPQGLRDRAN